MSGPQNYIIVNNEAGSAISDGLNDLVRYIDSRSKDGEASLAPLAAEFKAQLDGQTSEDAPLPPATQPIFAKIAENSAALLRSPPSEFEPVLNLLWYVLSNAPDFDAVITPALHQLTGNCPAVHAQQLALLAVLGSLFNITSAESPQKPVVFEQIVDLAIKADSVSQIVPQLPQLAEWLRDWQISEADKSKLATKLAENAPKLHSNKIREFLTLVVTYLPDLHDVAQLLVSRVLRDSSAYNFDTLLHLPGVQNLKGSSDGLYEALLAIAQGDYTGFTKLDSKLSQDPVLLKKARETAVARLAANVKSNELSYSEVSSALDLQDAEVEALIVDTVKSGLVRGRMNQLQQIFFVEFATVVGEVNDHHYDVVESRLEAWKKSLGAILDVSKRARSNHDLVKTLNKLEVN